MSRRFAIAAAGALAAACSSSAQPNATEGRAAAPAPAEALSTEPIKQGFGRDVLEGWLLACDNRRVCRAQPRNAGGSLMIRRDPGPNGLVRVVLDGQEPGEPLRPDIGSIRLAGIPAAPPAPWRFDPQADQAILEGDAALAFVRRLIGATSLSYDSAEGRLEVPLDTLRAALEAMDRAQGHAGGEAAFVSVGTRPRALLPAAPATPVIEVAPPGALPALPAGFAARVRQAARRHVEAAECGPPERDLDEAYPLDAAKALVILECGHGLTNSGYLLLRAPRDAPGRAVPIVLPAVAVADDGHEDPAGLYTNIEWHPETRSLESVWRSCMGGCGESVLWVYDGRDFRLASFTFFESGGAEGLDLYRAEVRR